MICAIVNELQPTFFFVLKFSSKVHSLLLNSFTFHFLPSDVLLISAHHHGCIFGGGGGGGV